MELISLKAVLTQMDNGEPFNIDFVTADRKRKTGGEIIHLDNATCTNAERKPKGTGEGSVRKYTAKNPNHFANRTRNLRLAGSTQFRKVNILLIIRFNGKKVYY